MAKPSITPRRWQPPSSQGLVGAFAPNGALTGLTRIEVPGSGPEDIAFDVHGTMFTGLEDGRIFAMPAEGARWRLVTDTGGRPLGIEIHPDGHLIVCDAVQGLLRIHPDDGEVTVLVSAIDGEPLRVTNNASIARDGTIYFSQSSRKFDLEHLKADLLEHGEHGRLLRYKPNGETDVLLEHLSFANGVCLAADESFLLVAETSAYRIRKYWLTGPNAGRDEILIENLPGFPDNISLGSDGRFWVAMPSERNTLLDTLLPKLPFLRRLVWAMPDALQPEASRITFVFALNGDGEVVANLQADGKAFHYVTGVREHRGSLYLGSLMESAIAHVEL
jgi:sugar lactone lactonase YvrE